MLTAVSNSFFGYDYILCNEAGAALGRVKINWGWGESGTITLGGDTLEIKRDGLGPWQVRTGGKAVATIIKPSAFSRSFKIIFGGAQYGLEGRFWSSTFDCHVNSRHIGSLERYGLFSRKMIVNLPDELPLTFQAIAVWVVLLMWRRAAAAAAAS